MEVELLDYRSGKRVVTGVVRMVAGEVVVEGDLPRGLREEFEQGIVAGPRNKRVTMDEGEAFLRALPLAYSGSYFRAELIR